MIHVKRLTAEELAELSGDTLDWRLRSSRSWHVTEGNKDICLFGITEGSLITAHRAFVYPRADFARMSMRGWRRFHTLIGRLCRVLGRLVAFVDEDFAKGCRLVRFAGFVQTGAVEGMKVFEKWPH